MAQPTDAREDLQAESRNLFRESLVQTAVLEIQELLDSGEPEDALALFRRLHPVDQGGALGSVGEDSQLVLLEALTPTETAGIFEEMEPRTASDLSRDIETERLAGILELTSPDAALRPWPTSRKSLPSSSTATTPPAG